MEMTKRDYYEVLGVKKEASKSDIKRAYRRLAKKHHPDMNKDNPKDSEEKFKELSEAYEVLADEDKRKRYDAYGHAGIDSQFSPGGFSWSDFTHFSDIEDLATAAEYLKTLPYIKKEKIGKKTKAKRGKAGQGCQGRHRDRT